jgi:hypothetical protein
MEAAMKRLQLAVLACVWMVLQTGLAVSQTKSTKAVTQRTNPAGEYITAIEIGPGCSLHKDEVGLFIDEPFNKIQWTSTGGTYLIAFDPWYESPCFTSRNKFALPILLFEVRPNQPSPYCHSREGSKEKRVKYDILQMDPKTGNLKLCKDPAVIVSDGGKGETKSETVDIDPIGKPLANDETDGIRRNCKLEVHREVLPRTGDSTLQWTPVDGKFSITFSDSTSPCLDKPNGSPRSVFAAPPSSQSGDKCFVDPNATIAEHKYTVSSSDTGCSEEGVLALE